MSSPDLILEALKDERVVYDRRTHQAHALDAQAARIYRAAGNGCSLDDLTDLVEGDTLEQRRPVAQLGVQALRRAGLVSSDLKALPRRSLLKALGTAAAAPVVISILAPTPAAAASTLCTLVSGTVGGCTTSTVQISGGPGCSGTGLLFNSSTDCTGPSAPVTFVMPNLSDSITIDPTPGSLFVTCT